MIEHVKTRKWGLVRADKAAILDAHDEKKAKDREKARKIEMRNRAIDEAAKRGFNALQTRELIKVVTTMAPDEAVRITTDRARAEIGPDALAKLYPCRLCAVAHDETYKATCKESGIVPCFIPVGMKGCPMFKPKAIVGLVG